jgi:hypothetical protein
LFPGIEAHGLLEQKTVGTSGATVSSQALTLVGPRCVSYRLQVLRPHHAPWRLLASLQTCLWAVLVLCLGTAFGSLPHEPVDFASKQISIPLETHVGSVILSEDPYEGEMEGPVSLHRYLYANGGPVNGVDPSGRMTLGEMNAVMNNIGTLSRMSLRVINLIDKVKGTADAVQTVSSMLTIGLSGTVASSIMDAKSMFGIEFDPGMVISSLEQNLQSIMSRMFKEWAAFFMKPPVKRVKGITIYLPTPPLVGLPEVIASAGKINGMDLEFVFGGPKFKGRIVGMGVNVTGAPGPSRRQIWRMDYHGAHYSSKNGQMNFAHSGEIAAWPDYPFHYHVLKPEGK